LTAIGQLDIFDPMAFKNIKGFLADLIAAQPVNEGKHGAQGRDIVQDSGQPILGRTVVRHRGCFSCANFERGDLAQARWDASMFETAKALTKAQLLAGKTPLQAKAIVGREIARAFKMFAPPKVGICLIGSAPVNPVTGQAQQADFVSYKAMCDKWRGMSGTLDAPMDEDVGIIRQQLNAGEKPTGGTVEDIMKSENKRTGHED
jgi:hypothetical protein